MSRYITGLNRTSEETIVSVWIYTEFSFLISSDSIYYGTQSDIRVKIYCHLNFYGVSVFNFEHLAMLRNPSDIRVKNSCRLNLFRSSIFNFNRLDILGNLIGHPNKKLFPFVFAQMFHFYFRASRYITGLNWTSESKVIVDCICSDVPLLISSVSIY